MKAMVLESERRPLVLRERETPAPDAKQIQIKVEACAVCRTDLHIADGELKGVALPIVPGHQIVGRVSARGKGVRRYKLGQRVGVSWLASSCGECIHCRRRAENLCDNAQFTGMQVDGGFAEFAIAREAYCFAMPDKGPAAELAPLLCGGMIGYRALRLAGEAESIGFYGFGSAAHILSQVAVAQGRKIFAFTRPGDANAQEFARKLGVEWCGGSDETPPAPLDAAIIFAPAGELVPAALRAVRKGGTVVCAGIHMSDIPAFPYAQLWGERVLRSVAHLTRRDGDEFLALLQRSPVRAAVERFPLADANSALDKLRRGDIRGTAVLTIAE